MSFIHKYVSRIIDLGQARQPNNQIKETTTEAKKLLKEQDYFNLMFLKPIQTKLKTKDGDSLPSGMQLVIKDDISLNKYKTVPIHPVDQKIGQLAYTQIIEHNLDNGISVMKNPQQGIELAICVCMYSEDKKMLKSTLSGIHQNIDYFVRSGVSSDKIAICVMMDGIEKVDESVVQYFDELQRECGINLTQNSQQVNPRDIVRNRNKQQRYDQEIEDNNSILFTPGELKQRQQMRFRARVEEYRKIRSLKQQAQKLKKTKGLTYDVLDSRIQKFFIEVAKEAEKDQIGVDSIGQITHPQEFYIEKYTRDIQTCRSMINQALQKASQHCDEYIRSRQQLALVNYFRTKVFVMRRSKKSDQKDYDNLPDQIDSLEAQACRMNLYMCTKYKNAGKLSSHNWFFNGFCKELNPKYAILVDVGLRPEKQALFRFYQHMKKNPKVGGVCGYMGLKIERATDQLGYQQGFNDKDVDIISRLSFKFFDIQRAQQMQYHLAHLLDKPFQALFGFIHVLPGAFSGYNMNALLGIDTQGRPNSNQILKEYFKSIQQKIDSNQLKSSTYSPFDVVMKVILPDAIYYKIWPLDDKSQERMLYNQNIYLAEDRILCMGIHQNKYQMSYLPDAYAWVDPMKNTHTLLGQRKRWINGSFFAFEKVKSELAKSEQFQFGLQLQMIFLSFMNVLGYVSPSLFLFTVSIAMQVFVTDVLNGALAAFIPSAISDAFVYIINFVYIITTAGLIFYSMNLTNRDKKFIPFVYGVSTMLGLFSLAAFAILIVDIIRGSDSFLIQNAAFVDSIDLSVDLISSMRWIIVGIMGLYAVPVVIFLIFFRKCTIIVDLIFSTASFLFYSSTYLNILNIYALCRINDISWGTKGLDTATSTNTKKTQDAWSVIRLIQVGKYLFWNIVTSMFLLTLGSDYITRFWITFVIMIILALTLLLKVLFGSIYMIKYACCSKVKDPQPEARVVNDSRVQSIFMICKPELQKKVSKHLQDTLIKYSKQLRQTNPKDIGLILGANQLYSRIDHKKILQDSFKELAQSNRSRISKIGSKPLANNLNRPLVNRGHAESNANRMNQRPNQRVDPKDKFKKDKINQNNNLEAISQQSPIKQLVHKQVFHKKHNQLQPLQKKQSSSKKQSQQASLSADQDKLSDKKMISPVKEKPATSKQRFRRSIN